jgi:hypothetical protein
MNVFFRNKDNLDAGFYFRQIFPAVHIADFRLASKGSVISEELEDSLPSVAVVMPVFNTN